jgi:hypothetical protein
MPMTTERLSDVLREVWHPSNVMEPTLRLLKRWTQPRPRFAFLTASYVEHLGLQVGPWKGLVPRPKDLQEMFARPLLVPCKGVVFDGWFYAQEFDGGFRAIHPVADEPSEKHRAIVYPVKVAA